MARGGRIRMAGLGLARRGLGRGLRRAAGKACPRCGLQGEALGKDATLMQVLTEECPRCGLVWAQGTGGRGWEWWSPGKGEWTRSPVGALAVLESRDA